MTAADDVVHINDDTYVAAIEDGLVLLDFWAEWCGPCTALEPVLAELAEEYPPLTIAKIDVEENDEAMSDFGVQSIPTLILFDDGQPVEAFAGKVPYPKLERAVEKHTEA